MENLNLDIDSYSLHDLINLFSLDKTFTAHAVSVGKNKLHSQLQKVSYLGSEKKREIGLFIDSAAGKLSNLNGKKDKNEGTWSQKFNTIVSSDEHFVIQNPNILSGDKAKYSEGRLAGEEKFPAGKLNPINIRTTVIGINIDTRFRNNYYRTDSADFVVNLPRKQSRVVTMRIGSLDIPASWYAISRERGNANFVIIDRTQGQTINIGDSVVSYHDYKNPQEITLATPMYGNYAWLVTLPDGNYEMEYQDKSKAAPIGPAINNAIENAIPGFYYNGEFYGMVSPAMNNYLTGDDITYINIHNNGKSSFQHNPSGGSPGWLLGGFDINFNVAQNGYDINDDRKLRLGWELGFREEAYFTDVQNNMIISEGICLIGPRYFYVSIEDGQKNAGNSFIAAFNESTLDKNIITRINCQALMDDSAVYRVASDPGLGKQLNSTREYFGPVDIERLHISLIDEYGRKLDLNNMDWSLSLLFESLYD